MVPRPYCPRDLTSQSDCLNLDVTAELSAIAPRLEGSPMKPWLGLVVFVGICAWFAPARQSRSDEPGSETAADERLQAIKELLEQSVDWYDVLSAADAKDG